MALYAIGDIQGCFLTLSRLLSRIAFDPRLDRVWLVGDLVNRGPRSLDVVRWARALGERATVVLGNHDLHLLGRAFGLRSRKRRDTLDEVLEAPDRDVLVEWLRRRPLLHFEDGYLLVHAGVLPEWTVGAAELLAREAEAAIGGDQPVRAFETLKQEGPSRWREGLDPDDRLRVAVRALTRMRTLTQEGCDCPDFSGPPAEAPAGCRPWFDIAGRRSTGVTIVCGHWAALGLYRTDSVIHLDSGCVWGGSLTAVRLDDGEVFQEPLADGRPARD
jgi:bis(5'-nucleosyl)-tetraphosphatase (symmetrical)